jgi:spoIIIJ-associated protein
MEKSIVSTGKTIDLAIDAALSQLGLDRDSVSVQVLQKEKAGFLGFGAQMAKVQVTYEVADPEPSAPAAKSALGSASRSKPRPAAAPVKKPEAPKEPKVFAPAEAGSVEEKIETFLKGLLEHMGSQAVPHAVKGEDNTYRVELVGEDLGFLIGRRGDTLDAIQHLCNYSINRDVEGHVRINVDAEDYRAKREESLRKYARKKAQQVLKVRRRTTLEPMNAYERHVIHATLQEMDNITTHSTGTEPNRRVVIEYVR